MHPLALAVGYAWLVFWIYWLVSASTSKESVRGGWRTRLTTIGAVLRSSVVSAALRRAFRLAGRGAVRVART
jgi:hypothetical protein